MPAAHRRTTTERGLGHKHQTERKNLIRVHVDGTPCWWCGQPMYRDKNLNYDRLPLGADHTITRANGGRTADRLLHGRCNSQRGDGSRDHQRPALTGQPINQRQSLGTLAMPWP